MTLVDRIPGTPEFWAALAVVCFLVLIVGMAILITRRPVTDRDLALTAIDEDLELLEREARRRRVHDGVNIVGHDTGRVDWDWREAA